MSEDVNTKARTLALIAGALIYTTAQTAAWWPDIAQSVALNMRIAGVVLRATSLILLVAIVEHLVLWWMTRRIRGEWIYQENSEYWGYAVISLQGSRLRYSVDLYRTKVDLLKALKHSEPVPTMGHGDGHVSFLYSDGRFLTWYHVPAFLDYPQRHGTLTLAPTNDSNNYHGGWERTGALVPTAETSGDQAAAELARRDEQQHSGTFKFFIRKKIFLSQTQNVEQTSQQ
jgi:hypothetical protein